MFGKECETMGIKMPKECCRSSSFILSYSEQPYTADYFQPTLSAFASINLCFQELEGSHLHCTADYLSLC